MVTVSTSVLFLTLGIKLPERFPIKQNADF